VLLEGVVTLIYLGIAWLAGIFLGSLLNLPMFFLALVGLVPLVSLFLWRKNRWVGLASVCVLALLLGAWRYSSAIPHFDESTLAYYNDEGWVKLTGVVSGEPDVRDTYTNLRVAADSLALGDQEYAVTGAVLVRAPRYPEYRYGDRLEIEGLLETPPEFESFSYKDYLARQGIHSLVRRPRITLLATGQGNFFYARLYAFKSRAQATIAQMLPEPQASLLTGILLGVETGIPADLMADFSATGTTHIIAISGFNLSIIAGLFSGLSARLFGRRRAMPFALAGIILYTLFVGASAAVVRAAIMGSLYVIAIHYGRQSDALNSLMAAAILMTVLNPFTLWDLGFQLSFAATLGLVLYTPVVQGWFEHGLRKLLSEGATQKAITLLNEALIVTLAAQITTLPIIVYNFHTLSLVTLLTNLLILPAQPGVMLWGGVATIAGLLWVPLGQALGWVAWLFLTFTIVIVELTARVPYASLDMGRVSMGLICLYYGLLAGGTIVTAQEPSRLKTLWQRVTDRFSTKALVAGLVMVLLLVWGAAFSLPDGKLHVAFLDVGQGDAIFVQTPQGHKVLVDGGPSPTILLTALGRRMPFWKRTIDLVVLTHPHDDHVSGLIPVFERYKVKAFLDGGQEHPTPTYARCLELVQEKGIPYQLARDGMRIQLGEGLQMKVLHPQSELLSDTGSDINNNSIVLRLAYGRISFLLPGDVEEEAEAVLLADGENLASTILKSPHHGSDTSLNPRFLEAVNPQLAVIQVGADNKFGHPDPTTLDRLEEHDVTVLRTDQNGTVEVVSDGEKYWIEIER
jgi:competence protein ComEC